MNIARNGANVYLKTDLMFIQNMVVYIYGPSILLYNTAKHFSILKFMSSVVTFTGKIISNLIHVVKLSF